MATSAIGVFDSGIGGLTVVKELFATLPNTRIVYFGDNARVPYGTKSVATVRRYAQEDTELLLQHDVSMIVVACNTVSAVALDVVRQVAGSIAVLGMIDPAASEAVKATRNGKIGIIGTQATVSSQAYERAIIQAGATKKIETFSQACPLFVPLAEEGWQHHEATRLTAREYLQPLIDVGVDTLILGCTHYPVLAEVISEIMGPQVVLINSGAVAARAIDASTLSPAQDHAQHLFMVSDLPDRFKVVGERFLGQPLPATHQVVFKEAWVLGRSA